MEKQIVVWTRLNFDDQYISDELAEDRMSNVLTSYSYDDFLTDINNKESIIHTTQLKAVDTEYIQMGYRIFVYMPNGKKIEMKIGSIEGCNKEIRVAHNLERMLVAGAFGKISRY